MSSETFELTYATMFDPPESLHTSYDHQRERPVQQADV